ncbi:choice-of-anchor A family protein [Archangium sp.]|uniref:choice-of-anchor A family protein n=1 Tax=Archangium sp. TaxID=1872627 RepID=UPI002ED871F2
MSTAGRQLEGDSCSLCLDLRLGDGGISLGDYNVFLLKDYTGVGNVGGKVAAGGNIRMPSVEVGEKLPDDNVSNTLVAGGNLTLDGGTVYGDTWYGSGSPPTPSVTIKRGTVKHGTPPNFATYGFEERFTELRSLSSRLANLKSNGHFDIATWKWVGPSSCLNVFEFNASDFSKWWALEAQAGSFVVINIHGKSASFPVGIGGIDSSNSRRVLYNFVDATSLTAKNFGLMGTVLAPNAEVTFEEGNWSGGVYAVSLNTLKASIQNNPLYELAGVDCGASAYCDGTCEEKKELGVACGSDNQCDSEKCVDGFCCNTACDGECDACNLEGHKGMCSMVSSEVKCRASGGDCDVAEYCTGAEAACPADAVAEAGASCRAGSGSCDVAEACDGSSKACPPDRHLPDEADCGTSTGEWGSCEGFSDYCDPSGTESRTVTASTCGAGTCAPSSTRTETRSCTREPPGPQPCPEDSESWGTCGGFNGVCGETGTQAHSKTTYKYDCATGKCEGTTVNDTVTCTRSTAGVQCRAAAHLACDVAEYCSGGVCPADGKTPAGTLCDDGNTCTTSDKCDGAGSCNGMTQVPSCPVGSETVDACGGFSNTCDETGTRLRTKTTYKYNCATAKCEATTVKTTESCTRSTAGVQCRAAGVCDVAEYCSGGVCPADGKAADGSSCGSGRICEAGTCESPPANCPSMTKSWGQWQPAWKSNPATQGAYFCSGTVPAASHGSLPVTVETTSSGRVGRAQFTCDNGSWRTEGGASCDGKTKIIPDEKIVCRGSDTESVLWIGWYMGDLKRCPDRGGLEYWLGRYHSDDSGNYCLVYGKYTPAYDACYRAAFQAHPEVLEVQANGGHITSDAEDFFCGLDAAYPWTSNDLFRTGNICKYKP